MHHRRRAQPADQRVEHPGDSEPLRGQPRESGDGEEADESRRRQQSAAEGARTRGGHVANWKIKKNRFRIKINSLVLLEQLRRELLLEFDLQVGVPHALRDLLHHRAVHVLWDPRQRNVHDAAGDFRWSDGAEEVCDGHRVGIFRVEVPPDADGGDADALRADRQELSHRLLAVGLDAFQELQRVESVAVDDVHADGRIDVVRERILADEAARDRQDVRRIELLVHGRRLARVDHEEQLVVALLLPHLLDGVGQLLVGDFLRILELQEALAAMTCQVDENVGPWVRQELLAARSSVLDASGEKPNEILNGHFVPAVIDFDIIAVHVDVLVGVVEHRRWTRVPRVARHVLGNH